MDTKELKQKTHKELLDMLAEQRKKIEQMRFDIAAGKLKKTHEYGLARKTVARIKTILKISQNKQ
ncbi:MAG: 50S ribosomal protein L29 [Candidatus Paceibacterota bacterium]